MTYRAAVLVVSDKASQGTREDTSGPSAKAKLEALGYACEAVRIVPDEIDAIAQALKELAAESVDLILTSGGTGFAPRDVTPEATARVLGREAEGLAEYLRRETSKLFPMAVLGRGKAGTLESTLVVNAPGSPKGVVQYVDALAPLLPHILELLHGSTEHGDVLHG